MVTVFYIQFKEMGKSKLISRDELVGEIMHSVLDILWLRSSK